jgi:hypothetical protein
LVSLKETNKRCLLRKKYIKVRHNRERIVRRNFPFVALMRNFLAKSKARPATQGGEGGSESQSTRYRKDKDFLTTGWFRIMKDWYDSQFLGKASRKNKYDVYKFLDKNLAEATSASNVYSDNVVSGAIGGIENYVVLVEKSAKPEVEEVIKETERRTRVKDVVWDIARDMTVYGDDFEEVVIVEDEGKYWIDELKKLPKEQLYADVDERGIFRDSNFPYVQKDDSMDEKDIIRFDWWRILHFKVGRDTYGVDNSLFANASQRIGRQLLWIDDSVILARLSRAWQRFAWLVDTKNLGPDEAWEYMERFKERVKRKEVIDRDTGQMDIEDSIPLPSEDLFIPTSDTRNTDLKVLSGDMNIGNIEDIKYIQRKFFMAVNMPKAYAGLEEGVRSKATLSMIDVQFARQVRRRQNAMIPGLTRFYELAFVLAGIDPKSFQWKIQFPELNTADELLRWEMLKVKAEVAEILGLKVGALNNLWIYKEVLGFDDAEIEDYASHLPEPGEESFDLGNLNPKLRNEINNNPIIRMVMNDMRDILALKAEEDRNADRFKGAGQEREERLSERW